MLPSSVDHHIMLHNHIPMPMPPRWKPTIEVAPNCPRCASTNTKFCYYNNYSLSQPRYFCKACRRYWTKGGSLRNVPVGGGCRKNRRSKSARNQTQHRLQGDYSSSSADAHQPSSSRDIDMAVVFANFLNQAPISEDHGGSSSSNNSLSGETENDAVVVQPKKNDDFGVLCADVEPSSFEQELSLMSGIELDGFDDVVQHDDGVATWQPPLPPPSMMQMQEMEFSMVPLMNEHHDDDDELLMMPSSMNLVSDDASWNTNNWSSFDLSTMEVFSSSSSIN
ncbi:hypothetical protein HN51_052454 [Arachis hypogaea]|uniref:Dof zinc finger protein n=1 Tax=Arachis hypogaea TaxID=3818 RepID=A0A445CAU8_ARAHY|nr:dof zinc finger protein DOF1.2 [Arachis ipaensis]XP_025669089.1 dof zinc finger protein DOF1.2 [Arachis hypogaea]QHN93797.1 Dof zinc finger protein [Arachis hypogaea]RYR47973.1 hypothetical protein Ahy_A07g033961 [Arachis hypogaea]